MSTSPCASRADESLGFPSALRARARAAVALVAQQEIAPPLGAFDVNVDGEALRIPYRLYYDPDRLRRALDNAHGVDQRILACLGTLHHDGHVRQACLARLLGSDDAWVTPYVVQLAGEYVIDIVADVARAILAGPVVAGGLRARQSGLAGDARAARDELLELLSSPRVSGPGRLSRHPGRGAHTERTA